jgi:hypothetical protein
MLNRATTNPKIPGFLRFVTWAECLVVFSTASVLFFLPALGRELWAWGPPPFNSRYIGAVYYAALVPLVLFAVTGRWSPGRLVLWMIFTFTTAVMLTMLVHAYNFEWTRPATYAFWFLYLFLPFNSAVHLYLLRRLEVPDAQPVPRFSRWVLTLAALGLGMYGLALFLAPESGASFWPWPVDAFHGRMYMATFITPAVGGWLVRKRAAPSEYLTLGLTLVTLGLAAILGVLITNPTVPVERQVDFAAPGTWLFFLMNVLCAALGGGLMWAGWRAAARS